ncbi:peptidylprolyl isomerase [Pajaroellobacter abortibovis]|nr:peptidylprolyl isomerase [Pajaroellobacter abortibovis]
MRLVQGWFALGWVLGGWADVYAESPLPDRDRNSVVLEVGSQRLTVGELEDRIARMLPLQRAIFGHFPEEVRRRFLDEVVLPEFLLTEEALTLGLEKRPPYAQNIARAYAHASLRALHVTSQDASSISLEEVKRFYQEHPKLFHAPARYGLWRILVKDKEEAKALLARLKKDPTPEHFSALAREHSLDKSTYLRAGNLGFVTVDGISREPGLRVDPALVLAVLRLKDGEFVPEPIQEGEGYAVVWRRGLVAATHRTLAEASDQIRDKLWRQRIEKEEQEHLEALEKDFLKERHDELLTLIPSQQEQGVWSRKGVPLLDRGEQKPTLGKPLP